MDQSTGGQIGGNQPPPGTPPWQPPPPGQPPAGGGGGDSLARNKVVGPAIGLIVVASIGMFVQVCSILAHIFAASLSSAFADRQGAIVEMMSGTLGIIISSLSIIFGVVVLLGGMKMKSLENYSLAMLATILAMIPCLSPCCCLGIPIGIWSLVVLLDPTVKSAFRS